MKVLIILSLAACAFASGFPYGGAGTHNLGYGYDGHRQGYHAQPQGYGQGYHAQGYGQGYAQPSYQQPAYKPAVKHEDNGCKNNGDILRNGDNKCSFLECHPGNEPWYDSYGNIKLYTRQRSCPPGTSVAERTTKGYGNELLFSAIQYNPTHRAGYGGGYGKSTYTNSYMDMTAICSVSDTEGCTGNSY